MAVHQETVIILCLLAIVSSTAFADGNPIRFFPCKDVKETVGKLESVDIDPCPTEPCVFHKGTTVKATIKFIPSVTVTNGTLEIYGTVAGQKLPFPIPHPNPCESHGLECPLKAGQEYSLLLSLDILKLFPSTQLIAQMDFKVPDNKYVLCFQFPARISE